MKENRPFLRAAESWRENNQRRGVSLEERLHANRRLSRRIGSESEAKFTLENMFREGGVSFDDPADQECGKLTDNLLSRIFSVNEM